MPTIAEAQRQAVTIRRAEEALARQTRAVLERARRKLAGLLAEADVWAVSTGRQARRLDAIYARADEVIKQTYAILNTQTKERLVVVAQKHGITVGEALQKHLNDLGVGDGMTLTFPTRADFRALATSTPVRGEVMSKWWGRQSRTTREKFRDTVRVGYLNGESSEEIGKRVRDALGVSKRNADALARTAVHAIANRASALTYWANRDIAPAFMYVAMVDNRTTEICRNLHGKRWRLDDPDAKWPPQHFNCRSSTIPIVDYERFGVARPTGIPTIPPEVEDPLPKPKP